MIFTDICLFSDNVRKLVDFYEKLFCVKADGDDTHSFINANGIGIAVYSKTAAEYVNPPNPSFGRGAQHRFTSRIPTEI